MEIDVTACRESMYIIARNILRNNEDAEDAVQDALVIAFRKIHQFDPEKGGLSTWCGTITRNVCFTMFRDKKKFGYIDDSKLEFVPTDDSEYVDIQDTYERLIQFILVHKGLSEYGLNESYIEYYLNKGTKGRNLDEYAADFNMKCATLRTVFTRTTKDIRKRFKLPDEIIF